MRDDVDLGLAVFADVERWTRRTGGERSDAAHEALRVLLERWLGVPVAYEIGDGVVEHAFHAVVPRVAGEDGPVHIQLNRWLKGSRPCPETPWCVYGPGRTFRAADAGTLLVELGRRGVPLHGVSSAPAAAPAAAASGEVDDWVQHVREEAARIPARGAASDEGWTTAGAAPEKSSGEDR